MVGDPRPVDSCAASFQYSLCRVVLMVLDYLCIREHELQLSVLALSSRFDGLLAALIHLSILFSFSTRSVESF